MLRYKIVLILFTIAGIATGIFYFQLRPLSYKLTMIVKPTELNGKIFGQMLNNLDNLARSGSFDELAKNLNVSVDISQKISGISGQTLNDVDLVKDTTRDYVKPFIIQLIVMDNGIAEPMQQALINYFNNNRYLNKLKNDRAQLFANKLAFIDSELRKLDSLKEGYNDLLTQSKTPSIYYNNAMDPAKAYEVSANYYDQKHMMQEWLRQNKEVLVQVDGFKPSIVPNSTSMVRFVILYAVAFFLIGCLLMIFFQAIKGKYGR